MQQSKIIEDNLKNEDFVNNAANSKIRITSKMKMTYKMNTT